MDWVSKLKVAVIAATLPLVPIPGHAASIFDQAIASAHDFTMFPFWQDVVADTAQRQPKIVPAAFQVSGTEQSAQLLGLTQPTFPATSNCSDARTCAPPVWLAFLDSLRGQTPWNQMVAVNRWANAKPYVPDWINWHVPDYWETPGQFIAYGGDCEDYAITKYFSLVRLGFSPDDLRIVIVNDTSKQVFHAVLAVRLNGQTWLLDNEAARVVAMDSVAHYIPVYSLNQNGWWLYSNPTIRIAGTTITAAPMTTALPPAQDLEPAIPPAAPLTAESDHAGPQTSIVTAAAAPAVASSLAGPPDPGARTGYALIW